MQKEVVLFCEIIHTVPFPCQQYRIQVFSKFTVT